MVILVHAVGVLSLLILGLFALDLRQERRAPEDERNAKGELKGLKMPALAMEFVDNVEEVKGFLGEGHDSPMRRKLRRKLGLDNIFVVLYLALYLLMCVLLALRGSRPAPHGLDLKFALGLAAFAGACALGAAVADWVENARTKTLLDAGEITLPLVKGVAAAGFVKWLLIGVTTAALSFVFYGWEGGVWAQGFGWFLFALYVVTGALTLWGILGGQPRVVAFAFTNLIGVGIIVLALLFTLGARWVARWL